MDAVGVDVQLLSTCPQGPYTGDPTASVEAARCANVALAQTVGQHPERFRALVTVPLPRILASVDELNRAMEQDGMLGAAVGTSILGRPLSHPDFDPLFADLNRREAILFVHPQRRGLDRGPAAVPGRPDREVPRYSDYRPAHGWL
jgi:6-methylsalicylate decarboxylase